MIKFQSQLTQFDIIQVDLLYIHKYLISVLENLVLKHLRSDDVFTYHFIIQNQIWAPYSDLRNLMLLQISMSRI